MATLDVLILTHNEERHIARALQSVASFAQQVYIVDSGSTDRTVEIARSLGAVVLTNPFINYARQFQWGLDNAPITADWIMRLDADEVIEEPLAAEIRERLADLPSSVTGINLKRKHIFMGRWVRHGGRYPLVLLRIWRRGMGRIEDRWMDEHIIVDRGETVTFDNPFADVNLNDLTFFTTKHNGYATREAIDALNIRYRLFAFEHTVSTRSASFQAASKRFIKEKIYNRLPFWVGPTGYFLYRYIIQRGFLDGQSGLIYHFLQGFWYRFLVAAKVVEYDRELRPLKTRKDRLRKLEELTGKKLGND